MNKPLLDQPLAHAPEHVRSAESKEEAQRLPTDRKN